MDLKFRIVNAVINRNTIENTIAVRDKEIIDRPRKI